MNHTRLTCFFAALFFIIWAAPCISFAQDNQVKIGVLAKRGSKQCLKMWSPTAEYLSSSIPGKNFIIIPIDFEHIYKYVEKGKVDFILANSSFYVELESLYGVDRI